MKAGERGPECLMESCWSPSRPVALATCPPCHSCGSLVAGPGPSQAPLGKVLICLPGTGGKTVIRGVLGAARCAVGFISFLLESPQ